MALSTPKMVVVITGASSGPGRTIALEFALSGASLALGSRRESPLDGLRGECEMLQARTLAQVTDVADQQSVFALANAALARFGRVDIWINYAPPSSNLKDGTPADPFVSGVDFETSGYEHGAVAALACFKALGSGVLVNVDSLLGGAPPGLTQEYDIARRKVSAVFDDIARRANDVDGVVVSRIQPKRVPVPPETLAPRVVALAYAQGQRGWVGRLSAAAERLRFSVWSRTLAVTRRPMLRSELSE